MKRVVLFLLTNLAVMLVLSVVTSLLGVNKFLTANGLNLGALLGFALIMGFGGAIISLLMSKPMAKWSTGAQVINDSQDPTHRWIVGTVQGFAQKAGIGMPEVGIYEGEPNAFATGRNPEHAVVAATEGILLILSPEEEYALSGGLHRDPQTEGDPAALMRWSAAKVMRSPTQSGVIGICLPLRSINTAKTTCLGRPYSNISLSAARLVRPV